LRIQHPMSGEFLSPLTMLESLSNLRLTLRGPGGSCYGVSADLIISNHYDGLNVDGCLESEFIRRVENASAISKIGKHACCDYPLLKKVHFAGDDSLRDISGLQNCPSPFRIDIPVSVRCIHQNPFLTAYHFIQLTFLPQLKPLR
jgi:hypothetical protein